MTLQGNSFEAWVAKGGGTLAALCSIYSVAKDIVHRSPEGPGPTGFPRLSAVLILGVCVAVFFGVLWAAFEKLFGWDFGAGGHRRLPKGWAAIALSLSMTLPLVLVPLPYQSATGLRLLDPPSHWKGSILIILLGAAANLLLYGVGSFAGLRRSILPPEKRRPSFRSGIVMELVYTLAYFSLIVLPYRLLVEWPHSSFRDTVINRTALPAMGFFFGMAVFISIRPESLSDRTWIQVRGIVAALLLMGCFCSGMFG
jgi:hypothetical protein